MSPEETTPAGLVYADDLEIGSVFALGSKTVTEREIVDFALQWDPQVFHTDPSDTENDFGGVIASGLHSLAIFQRLAVMSAYHHWAIVAGRGLRDVQFRRPLRPGMTVKADLEVTAVVLDRPDRAVVTKLGRLTHDGLVIMSMTTEEIVRRCPGR